MSAHELTDWHTTRGISYAGLIAFRRSSRTRLPLLAFAALVAMMPATARAQDVDVHEAMSGHMSENPHLRLSPLRAATAEDSARAARIVAELRTALEPYRDVRVAERDGFEMFAPNLKQQPVFHFTSRRNALREAFRFDPTRPTSLLYRRDSSGTLRLVGAMYTAPKRSTWEELDARVPLGIARWHLHTNMCVPPAGDRERWLEVRDGRPLFGPASPIATRVACDAVDGRFLPVVFNWMVHVNVFEDDIWGTGGGHRH